MVVIIGRFLLNFNFSTMEESVGTMNTLLQEIKLRYSSVYKFHPEIDTSVKIMYNSLYVNIIEGKSTITLKLL
jgi:hypothetical protein